MSAKINDLSSSSFRKRFFENKFVPENNLAIRALRVSSKKQEAGKSFAEQDEITTQYSNAESLKIEKTWQVAESASKHDLRKHFLDMMEFIRESQSTNRPIKHIIFSHQSRSSRNKQSARELEELVDMGVTLHFARDRRKLTCKSDFSEFMIWVMENLKNQSYVTELTQNSVGGVIKCIERGCYPGSKLPYGYKSAGRKDRRHFELDGDRAKYMSAAFEIVDSHIFETENLTDKLLKEKLDSMFPSVGRTPNKKRFCELLRNPFYNGTEFIYDKTVWKANSTIQPAIVTKERWLRVQDKLNGRKRERRLSKTLPYTGMMTCSGFILDELGKTTDKVCGCSVTGERIVKKYKNGATQEFDYYRCSSQTKPCSQRDMAYMKEVVGRKVSFRDNEIEAIFQDIFKSFSFDELTCQKMKKYLWDEHFGAKKNHNERRSFLEGRMAELDSYIQQAYEDKIKGFLSEDHWRKQDSKWKTELADVICEFESLADSQDEYMQRGVQLIELMQHTEIIFKNATPEKKRKMVELVSSNLLLKDGTLEYHWRKPFDMLAVKGNLEDWRAEAENLRKDCLQYVLPVVA